MQGGRLVAQGRSKVVTLQGARLADLQRRRPPKILNPKGKLGRATTALLRALCGSRPALHHASLGVPRALAALSSLRDPEGYVNRP